MPNELVSISYVMKLLSLLLLSSIGLSASDLSPVAHSHEYAVYTPAPLIFAATPRMGSCPYVKLIGGSEQRCYGTGIWLSTGPGFGRNTYRCSMNASHKWAE